MAKLKKMYYYTSKGEKRLNCYYTTIPKELVKKAKIENTEVKISVKENKIVIERK